MENNQYKYIHEYYGYDFGEEIPQINPSVERDKLATDKEVEEKVAEAMSNIKLNSNGNNTYSLDINGKSAGKIEIPVDKYLTGVKTNSKTKNVEFQVKDGIDITVPLSELDDPNVDGDTF